MKHWNEKEEPLYYHPHWDLACPLTPSPWGTPTTTITIAKALHWHITSDITLCMNHPRSPKHLKETT